MVVFDFFKSCHLPCHQILFCALWSWNNFSDTVSKPIAHRPMQSGPGGRRPPGKRPTASRPPESGDRRCPVGCEPGHVHCWFNLARPSWVHPGDAYFSPGHWQSSTLHPIALQQSEWAEKALIQQKAKTKSRKLSKRERTPLITGTHGAALKSSNSKYNHRSFAR